MVDRAAKTKWEVDGISRMAETQSICVRYP
jgi:hypothetical protein